MTRLLILFFTAVLIVTCSTDKAPPLPDLGTATAPIIYENFEDVASLFRQNSDSIFVVNFWATWCKPCREEIPLLQRLTEEFANEPVQVVLVSLDTERSAIDRIPAFLEKNAPDLPSIVLTDEGQEWGKSIDRVWSGSLPTTIIYKKKLRYVYRREFRTYTDLKGAIAPLQNN